MPSHQIHFTKPNTPPMELPEGTPLAEGMDSSASPIPFGCKDGRCGTCLVWVEALDGALSPPNDHERDVLDIYAPGESAARLACQLTLTCSIRIDSDRWTVPNQAPLVHDPES